MDFDPENCDYDPYSKEEFYDKVPEPPKPQTYVMDESIKTDLPSIEKDEL